MKLTIKPEGAAFDDKPAEVARILRAYAEQVERVGGLFPTTLRDQNGNTCGTVTL